MKTGVIKSASIIQDHDRLYASLLIDTDDTGIGFCELTDFRKLKDILSETCL